MIINCDFFLSKVKLGFFNIPSFHNWILSLTVARKLAEEAGNRNDDIMKLRWDPFQVFIKSKTPAGLYARKKWLNEENHASFQDDFEETVSFLLSGQSPDGSWDHSFINTVKRLFALHLTVRDEIDTVKKGLDWLLAHTLIIFTKREMGAADEIPNYAFRGLPFTRGSVAIFTISATLFLSSVFGRENDSDILRMYDWLQEKGSKGSGKWCGWSSYSNILRAFVVHPRYAQSEAVNLAVKNLLQVQKDSGTWAGAVPFYQTMNALAHLDNSEGDDQLALAFKRLYKTQKHDGTWSHSQPEWVNFLIIHALKNKGEL